jgi:tetratricopeptide (TPR) repeat protein
MEVIRRVAYRDYSQRTEDDRERAEELLRRGLTRVEKYKGAESESTRLCIRYLADFLQYTRKDLDAAEKLLRRELEITETIHGPDSSETHDCLLRLLDLLWPKNDLAGVEAIWRRFLADQERKSGPDSLNNLLCIEALGDLLQYERKDFVGAEAMRRRALAIIEKEHVSESEWTIIYLHRLEICLREKGDVDCAEKILKRQFAIAEKLGVLENPIGNSLIWFAKECWERSERGAEREFREALAIIEKFSGPDHPYTKGICYELGRLLQEKGDSNGADEMFGRALGHDSSKNG